MFSTLKRSLSESESPLIVVKRAKFSPQEPWSLVTLERSPITYEYSLKAFRGNYEDGRDSLVVPLGTAFPNAFQMSHWALATGVHGMVYVYGGGGTKNRFVVIVNLNEGRVTRTLNLSNLEFSVSDDVVVSKRGFHWHPGRREEDAGYLVMCMMRGGVRLISLEGGAKTSVIVRGHGYWDDMRSVVRSLKGMPNCVVVAFPMWVYVVDVWSEQGAVVAKWQPKCCEGIGHVEVAENDDLIVWGLLTRGTVDKSGHLCDVMTGEPKGRVQTPRIEGTIHVMDAGRGRLLASNHVHGGFGLWDSEREVANLDPSVICVNIFRRHCFEWVSLSLHDKNAGAALAERMRGLVAAKRTAIVSVMKASLASDGGEVRLDRGCLETLFGYIANAPCS